MKSPAELAQHLARQWENPDLREARLIRNTEWPLRIPIGRPSAGVVAGDWSSIATHIRNWRAVGTGLIIWELATFRAIGEAVEIPLFWEILSARQWAEATGKRSVSIEFAALDQILAASDPLFHPLFVRQRSLWKDKPLAEICKASEVVTLLEPGCAHGAPLRAISLAGNDTKFFERHRSLITRLLDLRFDGEASRQGLETLLNAWQDDHWLLVADLDGNIMPFSQLRVRSSELSKVHLPVPNLLIVENERCLHMLPRNLSGTIAVLGTGNNLKWMAAPWVQRARVAYWGDIDTWGFTLLASARSIVPDLTALLMTREIFETYAESHAVTESVIANPSPPAVLIPCESDLYLHLLTCEKGRVEQEFISQKKVSDGLQEWLASLAWPRSNGS